MHRFIAGFCQQWRRKADCRASSSYCAFVLSALFRCSSVRSGIGLAAIWQRGFDSRVCFLFDSATAFAAFRARVGHLNLLASFSPPPKNLLVYPWGAVRDA